MAYFGIDLGTSSCLAAKLDEGLDDGEVELRLVDMGNGNESFPSVVSFLDDKNYLIGEEAAERLTDFPDSTVELVKVRLGQTSEIAIKVNGEEYVKSPQEITSLMLKHITNCSDEAIQDPVITVPAFFDQSQKGATMQAAEIAGMPPKQLIEEPTAALIYQIYRKYLDEGEDYLKKCNGKNFLVFDFGGGTLDLSLIKIECEEGEVVSKPLAIGGDPKLGGNLIDFLFTDYIIECLYCNYGSDPLVKEVHEAFSDYFEEYRYHDRLQFPKGVSKEAKNLIFVIKREAERVKKILSLKESAEVVLTQRFKPIRITREKFEEKILDDNDYICFRESIEDALNGMNYKGQPIYEVLLVGGSSQIPYIRKIILHELNSHGLEERSVKFSEDSMHAVALGAAIQAALCNGISVSPFRKNKFTSVVPRDIVVDCGRDGEEIFVTAGTEYPFYAPKKTRVTIPHALAIEVMLRLAERTQRKDGNYSDKKISEHTFHLPIYKTGDEIEVSLDIDKAGLYNLTATHIQTGEKVEFESNKNHSLTDSQMKEKIEEIRRLTEM